MSFKPTPCLFVILSPMSLDSTPQGRLDPGRSLLGVSAEEHVPYLKAPGPSHGGVQEAQVPQRHPTSAEIQDGPPKVRCVPEELLSTRPLPPASL
jgi:hypothetical protein